MIPTQPGIYRNISFSDYCQIDAINASKLKLFERSPAHALAKIKSPDAPGEALTIGEAAHAALFERERFERDYVKAPKVDRRGKEGRAIWDQFQSANADKIVMTDDQWNTASAVAEAVRGHPVAQELLARCAHEVTVLANDPETGLLCKARLDWIGAYKRWPTIVDVKTTRNAAPGPDGFAREIVNYNYHLSAAYYTDLLGWVKPLDHGDYKFVWLAVEKDDVDALGASAVAAYEADDAMLAEGRAAYRYYLHQYLQGKRDNQWPGYSRIVEPISLPRFGFKFTLP